MSDCIAPAGGEQQPLLSARWLTKRYGQVEAVRGVDFDLPAQSFVTILGPSGCGKTTILRMIGGFEAVTDGQLEIEGHSLIGVPAHLRPVNTVFQNYALFPHLTVADNVAFGMKLRKVPRAEVAARVDKALATVKMQAMAGRFPSQLSGGQQQRVALARAFVNEPRLLLLDEPLGALDLKMRRHMQVELKELQRRLGLAFLYVTHDQEEAFALSDLVIVMNHGRIEQMGSPEDIFNAPDNAYVADFIGGANLVPGTVAEVHQDPRFRQPRALLDCPLGRVEASCAPGLAPGDAASLCVRADHLLVGVRATDTGLTIPGTVRHIVFQGSSKLVQVDAVGQILEAKVDFDQEINVDESVILGIPPGKKRIVRGHLNPEGVA